MTLVAWVGELGSLVEEPSDVVRHVRAELVGAALEGGLARLRSRFYAYLAETKNPELYFASPTYSLLTPLGWFGEVDLTYLPVPVVSSYVIHPRSGPTRLLKLLSLPGSPYELIASSRITNNDLSIEEFTYIGGHIDYRCMAMSKLLPQLLL